MALKEDLQVLKQLFNNGDDVAFREHVAMVVAKYTDPESKELINQCVDELSQSTFDEVQQLHEDSIKLQMGNVGNYLSMSYIAKQYFGKTRAWLYQRINGHSVNGKPCRFTEEEKATFNRALQDISREIGSLHIA